MNIQLLGAIAALITAVAALVAAINSRKPSEPAPVTAPTAQPPVTQKSTAPNSPNIAGVAGNVTVNIGQGPAPAHGIALDTPELIGYGSRVGMSTTIRRISGKNTPNATLNAEHTMENAAEFCREYSSTARETCIKEAMEHRPRSLVTANCDSGVFTTFFGRTLRYEGKRARTSAFDLAEYNVYDIEKSEYLDGSMASGLSVDLQVFRTLYPNALRLGEIANKYPVKRR